VLICAVIWGGGYYFLIKDKRAELVRLEQTENELRTSFEIKQSKAVNLEAYKEQMKEMEVSFASMLQQLPRKSEVADLLVDISRTGLVNGLEFELFKPEEERPIDFYIELPITMRVTGSYHQFAEFVSGIAALPRIVTLHNFKMGPLTTNGNMTMDVTAKTYRYFDEQGN
jgi:type IV pilus assembly protein PilO